MLGEAQRNDPELSKLREKGDTALLLRDVAIPLGDGIKLCCDVRNDIIRPYIPPQFCKPIFEMIHNLSYPGPRSTAKLVAHRFVWPFMRRDCHKWTQHCVQCQQSKIGRHTKNPLGEC